MYEVVYSSKNKSEAHWSKSRLGKNVEIGRVFKMFKMGDEDGGCSSK